MELKSTFTYVNKTFELFYCFLEDAHLPPFERISAFNGADSIAETLEASYKLVVQNRSAWLATWT